MEKDLKESGIINWREKTKKKKKSRIVANIICSNESSQIADDAIFIASEL